MLITLLRHADRVKIACMAQLVNVIAPIMTSDTGAWRQTIFYPYLLTGKYGRGTVLDTRVDAPTCETKKFGEVSCVDSVVIWNGEAEELVIFAVNKNLTEDITATMELKQFEGLRVLEHVIMHNEDLFAVNTEENPNNVIPTTCNNSFVEEAVLHTVLKAKSWNMIRMGK